MMASGKGEVVKILEEMGYRYTSLSDIVREEAAKTGRTVTREEMQDIGNRLRTEGGPGNQSARFAQCVLHWPFIFSSEPVPTAST